MTRALIIESRVPHSFWPEAVATAVYLLNRLPTHILNFKTPLHYLSAYTDIPSSLTLEPKVFGCSVFVHVPKHNRSKFSPNAIKCVFLGYGKNQKGYRCYDPKTQHLHTTLNCDFVESEYFFHQLSSQGEIKNTDSLSWLHTPSSIPPLPLPIPSPISNPTSVPMQDVGPPEDVSVPAEPPTTFDNVQSEDFNAHTSPSSPSSNPEVSDHNSSHVNTDSVRQEDGETQLEEMGTSTPKSYLPPRSTRGVPPKRYSPDWQGRKTQHSIANTVQGRYTEMAQAFETALYEEDIPRTWKEAITGEKP